MVSRRFGRNIVLTEHARRRMVDREIPLETLLELVETGEIRYRDPAHCWIAGHFDGRADNLLCVAAVMENALVVKTAMHHFAWGEAT